MNYPLYIHPAIPPQPVINAYYNVADPYAKMVLTSGGWGWHIETGTHVLRMIAGGVFDRHPHLKVIVGHLGEGLPFFLERLYNTSGGNLKHPYGYYLQNNIYYTISGIHYQNLLQYVLSVVGEDHVMFSSDYPFMPLQQETDFIKNVSLTDTVREKIAHKNAENLLGL